MKINKSIALLFLLSATVFVFDRCKKDEDKETDLISLFDRKTMLENMADNYILPAYSSYVSSLGLLEQAVIDFESSTDAASISELNDKLLQARLKWQGVAFLEFGPAEMIGLTSQTNLFPIDTALINSLKLEDQVNLASVANYNAKGLEVVDYIVSNLSEGEAGDVPFLKALVEDLITNASTVHDEWNSTYKSEFTSKHTDNSSGSSVSAILNGISQHYESHIRKGKLGVPSGAFNGFSGQIEPEQTEAYFSGNSTELLQESIDALEQFYKGNSYSAGTSGLGFDDYIQFIEGEKNGEDLEVVVNDQFTSIITSLASIDGSIADAVQNDKSDVDAAYSEMQKLVPLIKVDVTAVLGVLITYQDTDGD